MDLASQYLLRHAEPEASLADSLSGQWRDVVVLPILDEAELLFGCLDSLAEASRNPTLVILVVNHALGKPRPGNLEILRTFQDRTQWRNLDLLVIDRSSPGKELPPREGVGLARKIGSDIAVKLILQRKVAQPTFSTTDADARVDEDYFHSAPLPASHGLGNKMAAQIYDYSHDHDVIPELALYEEHLRHYEKGLLFAGSPYAFPTIGSCLRIDAHAYMQVRGFPKLEAAEDFYILDKLAKTGKIERLQSRIRLVARHSDRVPFGTGRAAVDIQALLSSGRPYRLYDPRAFETLRELLRGLEAASKDETFFWQHVTTPEATALAKDMRVPEAVADSWKHRTTPGDRLRHLHTWFDSLKTLKWVHQMRDRHWQGIARGLADGKGGLADGEADSKKGSTAHLA